MTNKMVTRKGKWGRSLGQVSVGVWREIKISYLTIGSRERESENKGEILKNWSKEWSISHLI